MSVERAREHLRRFGVAERIREFAVSSATVELAARAVGCEPARIAKTLALMGKDGPLLVVAAGDARIDNPRYKARFGAKARMIPPADVERLVGYAPGGVCPFGAKAPVYLDESLRRFPTVHPAVGSASSAIELTPAELERCSGAVAWVDVCKTGGK